MIPQQYSDVARRHDLHATPAEPFGDAGHGISGLVAELCELMDATYGSAKQLANKTADVITCAGRNGATRWRLGTAAAHAPGHDAVAGTEAMAVGQWH